jgi:hypothetical protein
VSADRRRTPFVRALPDSPEAANYSWDRRGITVVDMRCRAVRYPAAASSASRPSAPATESDFVVYQNGGSESRMNFP